MSTGTPETADELIELVKSGTLIACDTVEQCREALYFFKDAGEMIGSVANAWLNSGSKSFEGYPNVGFSSQNCFSRFTEGAINGRRYLKFDDISPIIRGETQQDYEIDGEVFDALFPS